MRCTRSGGSIVGTCEVRLTQLTKDDGTRPIAELECGVFPCIRGRLNRREYPDLDAAAMWETAAWR